MNRSTIFKVGGSFIVALLLCCVVGVLTQGTKAPSAAAPTSAPVAQQTTVAPEPTKIPEVTSAPEPTITSEPTIEPTFVPKPIVVPPTPSTEQRYLIVAKKAALPLVRGDLPKGEWGIEEVIASEGPSIKVTMPLSIALSKEQFVRQAKRTMAFVTKALFDADPQLARINVIGTMADGKDQSELPTVSIVVLRSEYEKWDGLPENLTHWNVSQRYS